MPKRYYLPVVNLIENIAYFMGEIRFKNKICLKVNVTYLLASTNLKTGSSPVVIDYKRQLRAEQWARFCGRHSCAELIEKWSRTRHLEKETAPISKGQNSSGLVIGRARANSAVQTISKVNIAPIKSDRGSFYYIDINVHTKLRSTTVKIKNQHVISIIASCTEFRRNNIWNIGNKIEKNTKRYYCGR